MRTIALEDTADPDMAGKIPVNKDTDLNNPKVFESVFRRYYVELSLFANRFLNDLDMSKEVVSDMFTFLWERRKEIRLNESLKAYLYKAVQNRCLNYLKHKKIENEYVNYLYRNNLFDEVRTSLSNSYSQKELAEQIQCAVERLPEKCREVFKLSRHKHFKNEEIARSLNISQKTVERHITIALEKLRQSLKYLLALLLILSEIFL
ncbi:RNA polymerase sigma-70 factor [Pararcticibacter amylolyticus]|uniref:RNA polymerase sigma-70 factor n=1 Tax=Pararcticibacter amylolyticus TaxID=2173175 RepID=A0A2U2PE98_9SPHI|nr:RNA polymerase sigma-70 factor [Pararcticibacter amylolyticus]PWG79721.1 RNA polymerase sigma-70 factor [Pararcticibacter amylolyticus]